ncbi:MAG TPA: DUF6049 family protein [Jiangellaceae bacterium]|jgi:Family of unknown function (DUF6049)|nr:DUF6049 family protein [Jiangellaceae bacterium]
MPGLPSFPADGSGDRQGVARLRSVLCAATLVTAATLLGSTPAAAEDGPAATATLRTVEPAAPKAGDTLVLAGVVQNTGDESLVGVQANLRYSAIPLDDRADVRRVPTDDDVRWGQRPGDFFQPVDDELLPGESVEFALPIPVDEIDFGDPGVYAVGVDIRADTVDGERTTLATARTVIPWLPDTAALPDVPVALLWPLATQPALLPDGTFLDDGLAERLAPDGPLTALVEAPGGAPVSWLVDPDLLASAGTMADGYAVTAPDGTTKEGTGAAAAEAWLQAYRAATTGAQVNLLPYANPDVPAVAQADDREAAEVAREAIAASTNWASQTETAAGTEIAWPGGGVADVAPLAALASAGTPTVVLAHDAVLGTSDAARAQVPVGEGSIEAVLTDSGLESAIATLTAADPAAGVTATRQAWLAETAMTALAADGANAPPTLVAAAPYGWLPSPAVAQALVDIWTTTPWVRPTALADVPADDQTTVVPDPDATAAPPELTPEYVAAATELRRDTARYAALLAEPDALVEDLRTSTLRALATTWRAAPDVGSAYTSAATAEVTTRLGQVSVLVPESVTLSSKKGTFPLTVSNGLPQPVLVSVEVTADRPDRISIADVAPQRVEAGENATVEVTAEASANGKVPVTVRLTTAGGSPLGPPQRMDVNATDYGTIGWVVIGVAVALFLAAAALRLVRARRRPVTVVEPPVSTRAESEALRETAR